MGVTTRCQGAIETVDTKAASGTYVLDADESGVAVDEERAVDEALRDFVAERDWEQFHTPSNLAKSIAIEAGELLECFQWSDDAPLDRIVEELADVLTYARLLAARLEVDPDQIVLDKLE